MPGSEECWQSCAGTWVVLHGRPDDKFAVMGTESAAVFADREQFNADGQERTENHVLYPILTRTGRLH